MQRLRTPIERDAVHVDAVWTLLILYLQLSERHKVADVVLNLAPTQARLLCQAVDAGVGVGPVVVGVVGNGEQQQEVAPLRCGVFPYLGHYLDAHRTPPFMRDRSVNMLHLGVSLCIMSSGDSFP